MIKAYGIYKLNQLVQVVLNNDKVQNQHSVERNRAGWGKEAIIKEILLQETDIVRQFSPLEASKKR